MGNKGVKELFSNDSGRTWRGRYLWLLLAIVVGSVIAYILINNSKGAAHLSTVPADAKAVARIDVAALVRDAGLSDADIQALAGCLYASTDASHAGIDLTRPLYGFISRGDCFGLAARVTDKGALQQTLERMKCDVQQQRGYSWAVVRGEWLLAFSADKALLMGPATGESQNQLRNEMYRCLEQSLDESAARTLLFGALEKTAGPVAVVADTRVLPRAGSQIVQSRLGISDTGDLLLSLALNASPDGMTLMARLHANSQKVGKALSSLADDFELLEGRLLPFAHEDAAAWACVNVEGDDALQFLRSVPDLRVALMVMNLGVDADMMIKAVDGDVAVELVPGGTASTPAFSLTAELDDMDFLRNAGYWMQAARLHGGFRLTSTSSSDFVITYGQRTVWFGAHDNRLYATSSQSLLSPTGNSWLSAHSREIKGKRLYATVDMPRFAQTYMRGYEQFLPQVALIDRVTVEAANIDEWTVSISAAPGKNIFRELLLP